MHQSNLAEKLDSNSDSPSPVLTTINGGLMENTDPLDEISFRKTKRQHLREFGSVIALALVLIAGFKLYKGGNLSTILILTAVGAVFALLSIWTPRLILPVFKAWMRIGHVLEKVTTYLILGTMWFATFFPIGIVFKIIGKTPMTLGFEPGRVSYWEDCAESRKNFQLLERQY